MFYHIDELRKFEPELDGQSVGIIADRTDQSVVIGEEVLVESLGVLVT